MPMCPPKLSLSALCQERVFRLRLAAREILRPFSAGGEMFWPESLGPSPLIDPTPQVEPTSGAAKHATPGNPAGGGNLEKIARG